MFRAGLDYLALELRPGIYVLIVIVPICCKDESTAYVGTKVIWRAFPGVTDVQGLAARLLEVALLRVAKVTF